MYMQHTKQFLVTNLLMGGVEVASKKNTLYTASASGNYNGM